MKIFPGYGHMPMKFQRMQFLAPIKVIWYHKIVLCNAIFSMYFDQSRFALISWLFLVYFCFHDFLLFHQLGNQDQCYLGVSLYSDGICHEGIGKINTEKGLIFMSKNHHQKEVKICPFYMYLTSTNDTTLWKYCRLNHEIYINNIIPTH